MSLNCAGKNRPPEEKGKAGGQDIGGHRDTKPLLYDGGWPQHRRVVIHGGRMPCRIRRHPGRPAKSLANLDDGLGNAGDLAVEEVLHLFELELVADERRRCSSCRRRQADGVSEGQRVDEGALDGQLLLVDVVGVHLEVGLLRADTEHQHLRALLGGGRRPEPGWSASRRPRR